MSRSSDRVTFLLLWVAAACAADSGTHPDDGGVGDSGTAIDGGRDAGHRPRTDAAPRIPYARADLFEDVGYAGTSTFAGPGETLDLGSFASRASSLKVQVDFVAYGFSETNLGGTISPPMVGEVSDLVALGENDVWKSMTVRAASELYATVFLDVGANPRRYPVGRFPSLGANSDRIDGMTIPAGMTVIGYRHPFFDSPAGLFTGPLDLVEIPERDSWSSMEVRPAIPGDEAMSAGVVYLAASGGGRALALPRGSYPNISLIDNAFRNSISSTYSSSEITIWGFENERFGGNVYGPYSGAVSQVAGNDDWVSILVLPSSTPTVTVYLHPDLTGAIMYPVGQYPNLQRHQNSFDGVDIPAGVRVCGWSYSEFQQTKWELVGPIRRNLYGYGNDDWDSMVVTTGSSCP